MNYLHLDFKSACRWLADANNVLIQTDAPHSPGAVSQSAAILGCHPSTFDPTRYARFFEHPFLSEPARQFLFEERKLDERVIRWCRLTSWRDKQDTDWLQIPYFDREGHAVQGHDHPFLLL